MADDPVADLPNPQIREANDRRRQGFSSAQAAVAQKRLTWLWTLVSGLSVTEALLDQELDLKPFLSFETARLLPEAILESDVDDSSNEILSDSELKTLIDGVTTLVEDPRIYEIRNGDERSTMLYELNRHFSRQAYLQLRPQRINISREIGRLIALYDVLPSEPLAEYPEDVRPLIERVAPKIVPSLGFRPRMAAAVLHAVTQRYLIAAERLGDWLIRGNGRVRDLGHTEDHRKLIAIQAVRAATSDLENLLWFSLDDLMQELPGLDPTEVESCLSAFARSTPDLRRERATEPYRYGPIGWRLSVLQRFPVVVRDGAHGQRKYCVPNLRLFWRGISDVVNYILWEKLGSDYEGWRGAVQEIYLRRLLNARLPALAVVRERTYGPRRSRWKGPDLTVVDEPALGLLAVESKGQRVPASTKFIFDDRMIEANAKGAVDALVKLQTKLAHIRSNYCNAYDAEQHILRRIDHDEAIAIVVRGETMPFFSELLRAQAATSPSHALNGCPLHFCVVSLDTFEDVVEACAAGGLSLHGAFRQLVMATGSLELNRTPAEHVWGEQVPASGTFAQSFLK